MAKNIAEIKKEADTWIEKQIKAEQFVFKKSELSKPLVTYLTLEQVLAELNNQYLFIKSNKEIKKNFFLNNLWVLTFQFFDLAFDKEWYITGAYSYRFLVENFSYPDKQISISTKKKTNTIIELPGGISILASYDKDFDNKTIVTKDFMQSKLRTLKQEHVVLSSTESEYRTFSNEIISVLKSSDRDEVYIVDYFSNNNNPVLLGRLIAALRQIEDFSLRIELESLFKLMDSRTAIPANPFEEVRLNLSSERPSYINRLELSMLKAMDYLKTIEKPRRLGNKVRPKDIDDLIVEEAYHSLTIEGYTVTRALIEYLKTNDDFSEEDTEDLRNQVAMKGFMNAIKYIKQVIGSPFRVTEELSKKLFEALWSPSYRAKLLKPDVDIYRKHMVTILGARHVPPGHEKVPFMIDALFDFIRNIDNGIELAIFLHYFYVGIHPHSDGNGRISRFLMNLALINDKYKWLTIKIDDRTEYFQALEKSQVEEDISYFAEFILKSYKGE